MPFQLVLAKQLAKISSYVYGVTSSTAPAFGPTEADIAAGIIRVSGIAQQGEKATSYAAVLRYTDKTVLAFQGTIFNSLDDWAEDFRAEYNIDPAWQLGLPGQVHAGFAHQLSLISDQILADLRQGYVGPLYLTGHSQGAAVANLATRWLIQQDPRIDVAGTYTFAAPRAGDATFIQSLAGQEIYRVEFGDDIVPHVPLQAVETAGWLNNPFNTPAMKRLITTVANGYCSVGSLIYRGFGLHDVLQVGLSAEAEAALVAERRKELGRAGPLLLANHLIKNYIAMFDDDMWRALAADFLGQPLQSAKDKLTAAEQKLEELAKKVPIPELPKFKFPLSE